MKCLEYVFQKKLLNSNGHIVIHDAFRYEQDPFFKKLLGGGRWVDGSGEFLSGARMASDVKKEAYLWQFK